MKFSTASIALAASSMVAGVSANVNKVNSSSYFDEAIAEVLLKFNGSGLANYTEIFKLDSIITLDFPGYGPVPVGAEIPQNVSAPTPTWTLNSTEAVVNSGKYDQSAYTAMVVDAGAPGVGIPNGNGLSVRHYLANNLTISDGTLRNMTGPITAYRGPAPPAGSGPHRYMAFVFEQPKNFTPPAGFANELPVSLFDYPAYLKAANLSTIVAASFFVVANNSIPTNVSVAQTSAVPEASITALAASVSSSISAAMATETKAASGSSPNAAGALPVARVGSLLAAVALGAALL